MKKCKKCFNLIKTSKSGLCKSCVNKKRKGIKMKSGWHHSKETKDKISKANKGIKRSDEFKEKIKQANLGRKLSKKQRLKLSRIHFERQGGEYRKKTKYGYVLLYEPEHPNSNSGNRIFEHRIMMEKKIGRYLKKNEIVHHLNGKKDDNRLENLYLVSSIKEHNEREVRKISCPHCGNIINKVRL